MTDFNTLKLRQNDSHFADSILKFIFYVLKVFYFDWNCIKICSQVSNDKPSTGGRLNKKDGLTRYGNSHVKDKTS